MMASEEEIAAMRSRLKSRQEARRADADIDAVISMVRKRRGGDFHPGGGEAAGAAVDAPKKKTAPAGREAPMLARRLKRIEDVIFAVSLAGFMVCGAMSFLALRGGFGSPGVWLASAEICLIPYLTKVPGWWA